MAGIRHIYIIDVILLNCRTLWLTHSEVNFYCIINFCSTPIHPNKPFNPTPSLPTFRMSILPNTYTPIPPFLLIVSPFIKPVNFLTLPSSFIFVLCYLHNLSPLIPMLMSTFCLAIKIHGYFVNTAHTIQTVHCRPYRLLMDSNAVYKSTPKTRNSSIPSYFIQARLVNPKSNLTVHFGTWLV